MRIQVPEKFASLLGIKARYLLLYGGAGSGKSEFAARKVIFRCQTEGNHRFLITRKVRATAAASVVQVFLDLLGELGIPYDHQKSARIISFYNTRGQRNELRFEGLDNPEKIKSIKGITSVWMEEGAEYDYKDLEQINLRLRGITPHYKQIMVTFNPDEAQAPWLKEMFFADGFISGYSTVYGDAYCHHSTVWDNPFIDAQYKEQILKIKDATMRLIYKDGVWAVSRGRIYPAFNMLPLMDYPPAYETIYGIDFGYNVQTAVIQVDRCMDDRFYLRERLYRTHLTNAELIEHLKYIVHDRGLPLYADSAEGDRIEEMQVAGFNCLPAEKGPNSVVEGIKFLKSIWHLVYSCDENGNLHMERRQYKWEENKLGELTDTPVGIKRHLLDGWRYAMWTHYRHRYITDVDVVKTFKRKRPGQRRDFMKRGDKHGRYVNQKAA